MGRLCGIQKVRGEKNNDMDDMLKHNIGRIVNEYNNRDLPEFEGYSPL